MKAYANESSTQINEIKELKDKIAQIEKENSRLKEKNENLEKEKIISEEKLEENIEKEDNKVNDYMTEIRNLQNELYETQRKKKNITKMI